jgi:hypothetical protein
MEHLVQHLINQQVLIRSNMSGVHYGTLVSVAGNVVRLKDSRRLWSWVVANKSGISLSDVSIVGIDHKESRITAEVPDIVVFDVCEILPTQGMADATIRGAKTYKPT